MERFPFILVGMTGIALVTLYPNSIGGIALVACAMAYDLLSRWGRSEQIAKVDADLRELSRRVSDNNRSFASAVSTLTTQSEERDAAMRKNLVETRQLVQSAINSMPPWAGGQL